MAKIPVYLNTAYTFEERAADLVSRLSLEEKQALLGNNMAPVPRLGIKSYNLWSEALHGILGFANPAVGLAAPTSFPEQRCPWFLVGPRTDAKGSFGHRR